MSLSEAELQDLKNQVKYRDKEFELLNSYIHRDVELSSQCIMVHGFKSTGKTLLVTKFLQALGVKHTIMNCDESISKKLLLRRCFDKIKEDSVQAPTEFNSVYEFSKQGSSADNFSSFISSLQKFNASYNYNEHHVLVLDRLDQCFEYSADLLASFSRLRESSKLKNLSIIAILSGDVPKEVITLSNPHVYLKVYDESQVIEILQSKKICKFGFETNDDHGDFYNQYVKVIVGSFYQYTGSDLSLLINVVERLWEPFTRPVKEGRLQATEFVKVYKENIDLLTSEDVVSNSGVIDFKTFQREQELNQDGHIQDLPLHSKFLLLASYLASYNSQRNDIHKYSKTTK
ncbi:hypothetical protein G210_4796 [Candida maltosa Xu316]|uniref:Uncharacterized protein n=1 Tax=Candida maltosa (strain Xu316) TaxID=1245528 RepID=M3K4J9_CANMX|nr:hypothetical protein G210_4796 [Candida maltosa Xu316]